MITKHLTYENRIQLETLYNQKYKPFQIANILGFSLATIYNELKRGKYTRMNTHLLPVVSYSAFKGQERYNYNATSKGKDIKLSNDYEFVKYVEIKITSGFSPDAIIGFINRKGIDFKTKICTKTLYNYIDKGYIPNVTNKCLLYKTTRKKKKNFILHKNKRAISRSISVRPESINSRKCFGHWEMDLVLGKRQVGNALLVLTERKTRQEIILRVNDKSQKSVLLALNKLERIYGSKFKKIFKSITIDNGSEFADWSKIEKSLFTKKLRTLTYYCHPFSSWERGSNENQNGFIRRFILKGTRIENYSDDEIKVIQDFINNYPRKLLKYDTSNEHFLEELTML